MRNLARALGDERPALHVPWEPLRRLITPYPGSLIILLGAPGAMKSMLALRWCLGLDEPTRLVSLDTDTATQAARIVAALNGMPTADVYEDRARWSEWLRRQPLKLRVHDEPLTPVDIGELLSADTEFWGRSPGLVVVDDVSKLRMEDRGYSSFESAFVELHRIAKKHHTVVLALHHLHRGDSSNREKPVKLSDGKMTGEFEAPIVLGQWRPSEGRLHVGVLKNRFGEDSPTGQMYAELHVDPATVMVSGDLYRTDVRPAVEISETDLEAAGIRL